MKILIVGVGRSGTTSLLDAIGNQGYHRISEPYSSNEKTPFEFPLKEFETKKNLVVKLVPYQKPHWYKANWRSFMKTFSSYFDTTIFLDRQNFEEHYMSFINLWYKTYKGENIMSSWTESSIPKDFIAGCNATDAGKNRLHNDKSLLHQYRDDVRGNITWYEDLYGQNRETSLNIIKSWNLDLNTEQLHNDLDPKYRHKIL